MCANAVIIGLIVPVLRLYAQLHWLQGCYMCMSVSLRFRQLRKRLNLSQEDFGAAIECSRSHVSRVERGQDEYTYSQLKAIAELAGIPASVVMDENIRLEHIDWLPRYFQLSESKRIQFDEVANGILNMSIS